MNEKVSVIVPCYNQAQYLTECLDSVLSQTFSNWECIIVDDGSPDNTGEMASAFVSRDNRFKYYRKENGGLSSARNYGISKSSGCYILPLDSDDYISSDYMQLAIEAFENNPQLKVVYSGLKHFGSICYDDNSNTFNYEDFIYNNQIFCSCFYRKSHYDEIGGYDESMKQGLEDWEFLLRLIHGNNDVYRIPKICFFYRRKESSMVMDLTNRHEVLKNVCYYIYKKHLDLYDTIDANPIFSFIKMQNRYEDKYIKEIKEVRSSYSYRLGRFILHPFSWFKRKQIQ